MVRDGIFYALGCLLAAAVVAKLTTPGWALLPVMLAAFFLWFFRDPERVIPAEPGAIVSPADGKVTYIGACPVGGKDHTRISIFLNVFDVHVNRSPVSGVITNVEYRRGKFLNAMDSVCAEQNEQNIVTVAGEGHTVIFKQIAGLLARRIVFSKSVGQTVQRGERVGMIKFGSRTDLLLPPGTEVIVAVGARVKGGSSVVARMPALQPLSARGQKDYTASGKDGRS